MTTAISIRSAGIGPSATREPGSAIDGIRMPDQRCSNQGARRIGVRLPDGEQMAVSARRRYRGRAG
ncbi:MAG TPA: hypothetical protein VGX23_16235 [Actinocrinis sp.]|nr:hypothetical protein [Actinocrinis sp.]